jgi:hypothetical protein
MHRRCWRKRAPPDQRRAGVHALSQASLAYLKVLELTDLEARLTRLEQRFSTGGPRHG